MPLTEKLKLLRLRQGLTQDKLSKLLHVSRSCYANYESGRRTPPYAIIILLADFYHIPADVLLRENIRL